MSISNRSIAVALLSGAIVILLILAALIANPGPQILETTEGNARIYFAADRRFVNSFGDCVIVRWDVENIKTIYINNEPTIGTGSTSVCVDGQTVPTLSVTFMDDTAHEYKLGIGLMLADPLVWLLVFLAAALLFMGGYLLVASLVSRGIAAGRGILRPMVRGLGLFVLGIVMTLIVLELGLRFYFNTFGSEQDRVLFTYSAQEIQQKAGRFIGLPYVGYGPSPYYPEHNRFGYRGEEITIPKPEGVFRIVTLGASTTYGFGVKADEAYPAQLQKILREQYGYDHVEVVNGGVMGYTSWETVDNFIFRALELQPDLVIIYQGTNDVEARMQSPGCYNGISPLRGLTTFHGLWKTDFGQISPSALYRFVAINLGWMENPLALEFAFTDPVVQADCTEAVPVSPEDALKQNPPVYFERNLRTLVAAARANHIAVMLSRFIYPTADIVAFAHPDYWLAAIEEHNAITRRIAAEMDVYYYDLAADYVSEPDNWWSAVHMTARGTHQQASLYAAFLVKEGLLPDSTEG